MQDHSFEVVVDAKRVGRVVKIATSQAAGGGLSRSDIDSIFDVLKVVSADRETILLELERNGIKLTKPSGASVLELVPPAAESASGPVPHQPVVSLEETVQAAREVIRRDRWSRRPWERILEPCEEIGFGGPH